MGYMLLIWTLKFTLGKIRWIVIYHSGREGDQPAMLQTWVWSRVGMIPWRGHGYPLQYSCLEYPHRQTGLTGYCPWGCKESDTTKELSRHHIMNDFWILQLICYGNIWAVQLPRHICLFNPASYQATPSPLSPRVCSNSYSCSRGCYLTISSSAPSSFAFSLSHHQDLFQSVSYSHQVAKVLELQHQYHFL